MRDYTLFVSEHLKHQILAHGFNEHDVFGDHPVYAVVHIPVYKVEHFHGVILYQIVDRHHTLIVCKRLYRWIIEFGKVIHHANRKHPCRLCGYTFTIDRFLESGHFIRLD